MKYFRLMIVNASDHENTENIQPILDIIPIIAKEQSLSISHRIVPYTQASQVFLEFKPCLIIYSGRSHSDSPSTTEEAIRWYSWINKIDIPVLTICGSYQRWLMSCGARIVKKQHETGLFLIKLEPKTTHPLWEGYTEKTTYIFNHHSYFVEENSLPEHIIPIGHTNIGLAIVRDKHNQIYGFQGHPEKSFFNTISDAKKFSRKMFRNLFSNAAKACFHEFKDMKSSKLSEPTYNSTIFLKVASESIVST